MNAFSSWTIMFHTTTILFCLLTFVVSSNYMNSSSSNIANPCENKPNGFHTGFSTSNCSVFHYCTNQTLIKTYQCPSPIEPIFSGFRRRCVTVNLYFNECHVITITENADNCAWYSVELSTMPNAIQDFSCPYPLLFDVVSKECRHYSIVQCQHRFEPKDVCEYRHPRQRAPVDERPCWLTPSCRGKSNGYHGNILQECSSYFQCDNERFIGSSFCPRRMRFSDKHKACLPTIVVCENATTTYY